MATHIAKYLVIVQSDSNLQLDRIRRVVRGVCCDTIHDNVTYIGVLRQRQEEREAYISGYLDVVHNNVGPARHISPETSGNILCNFEEILQRCWECPGCIA